MSMRQGEEYWTDRYENSQTGWDLGAPSTPLKTYIDGLQNKDLKILIPGAGNAYEAEYLFERGFQNTFVLDISKKPLENFSQRAPQFPSEQLIHRNFFEHEGAYDLILEQTFFCAIEPDHLTRSLYAEKAASLLKFGGKLVGLWFKHPHIPGQSSRPFGGSKEEYIGYFQPFFSVKVFEDCYNSIPPRSGNELFGIFEKK